MATYNVKVHREEIAVDFAKLPAAARDYFIAYGIRQSLADAGADPEKFPTVLEKRIAAHARLDRIRAGEIPTGGGGGGVDPLDSATVALLRKRDVRDRATIAYEAGDVPSSRESAKVAEFLGKHFDAKVASKIALAAKRVVDAKRIDDDDEVA